MVYVANDKKRSGKLYADWLRQQKDVQDPLNYNVVFHYRKELVTKFKDKSVNDLKKRFEYLNFIPKVIQAPTEIWTQFKKNKYRTLYLKKYDKNIMVLCELNENNMLEYFNVVVMKNKNYINNVRKGYLVYYK